MAAAVPTLSDKVFQMGFVVPNLEAALHFFKQQLGVRDFLVIEDPHLTDQTYYGKPADMRQSIAFGYCGDMQIELIQPRAGKSTYTDFLERNPQGGLQHYAILVDDYAAATADMERKGFTLVQSGRNGETRFGYFDTDRVIGALTEIVYLRPEERAAFEQLKSA